MVSYWEVIEPLFQTVDYGDSPEVFARSIAPLPYSSVILFSAHMCLAEIHNGGFLQLFWNTTGVLVPEGIEGFSAIGMPTMATLIEEAARPLGFPYPRDRNERWDAILMASGYSSRELKRIFKKQENLYLAFQEAVTKLPFDALDKQFWSCAKTENGGFQLAATRYARNTRFVQ
jgi:hypothetical protein